MWRLKKSNRALYTRGEKGLQLPERPAADGPKDTGAAYTKIKARKVNVSLYNGFKIDLLIVFCFNSKRELYI